MNILKVQDDLKNFSQQQLVTEMQRPSGNVPQFLVLSELSRRKRMQTEQARAEAANTPTVAQEAVTAAGMPMGGVAQMAQAMAPKTSMAENTGIAAMMPKQPTRMATGGVVKMQEAGSVQEQIDKIMAEARANPNSITNTLQPAITELSLKGSYGKEAQRQVVQAAIAGELGPELQREVLSKALAGEYGDEVKEGAKRASGVLEQSGLRGFEPTSNQLAPVAATAETVVSPSRGFEPTASQLAPVAATAETVVSPSRGFEPTASQLAPIASMAETVKPEFESGILKSGIRGFEPTSNQLAPTAANAKTVFPPSMMTMPAMRDPAVIDPTTGQPYNALGLMRQQAEQARQANVKAEFEKSRLTPDELMVPFNNSPDPADLTRFLASQKPRYQGGSVPGGYLPSENQRLIKEAAEMADYFKKKNFMSSDRFNRTPEDKLKTPEEQFSELGATKQIIDGKEFFVTPIGNTYDSSGELVQGGKAIQAINSAQEAGEDFTAGGALPTSKLPLIGTDTVGPSLNFLPDITNIPIGSNQVDAEGNVIPETFKKAELNIGDLTTPDLIKEPIANLASILGVKAGSAPVTNVAPPAKRKSDGAGYFGDMLVGPSGLSQPPNLETGLVGVTAGGDPSIAANVVGKSEPLSKAKIPVLSDLYDSNIKKQQEDIKKQQEAINIFKNVNFTKQDEGSLTAAENTTKSEETPDDTPPIIPDDTPPLTPEQELLRKLDARSAESTGSLMDFYKDLEKDKKYETAMKMVDFGAELMKPTATFGEGAGNALKNVLKGSKDRKKEYNRNKIAILGLQEKIDASKAAALRSQMGMNIQLANLDLRKELADGSAAKAAREREVADFEMLGGIDKLNALRFDVENDKATNAQKLEYIRLKSMFDSLMPSGTKAKNVEIQDT